jgi:hypothetical protein
MSVEVHADALEHQLTPHKRGEAVDQELRPIDALCKNIEVLLTMKHPARFQLELVVAASYSVRLENTLESLKNTRRCLMGAGMEVRVTCDDYHGLHRGYPTSLDMFFEQSEKEWAAKLAKYRAGIRPRTD